MRTWRSCSCRATPGRGPTSCCTRSDARRARASSSAAAARAEAVFGPCGAGAARGALAGVALGGLEPMIGVAQGCMPIGEAYVVTRADGNVIQQIAGRPAREILSDAIRALPRGEARIRRAGVFAGLAMDPAKSPLERGDFLVRNLVGIDQASGAVAVAERVRVGQTIQFQIRDAEASREDLTATLEALARRLGGRRPAFGCYFDCAGRGRSEEHTSELQSQSNLVCRLLLEKKKACPSSSTGEV